MSYPNDFAGTYRQGEFFDRPNRPRIVCLCGSTRFWETFAAEGLRLTLEGKIVLSIGIAAPDSTVLANPETDEGKAQKAMLDELHKRKIDLADEVRVLNRDGYIGASTRGEVRHAQMMGKPIRWLETLPNGEPYLLTPLGDGV